MDRGEAREEAETRVGEPAQGRAGRWASWDSSKHTPTERGVGRGNGTGVGVYDYQLRGVNKHQFQLA